MCEKKRCDRGKTEADTTLHLHTMTCTVAYKKYRIGRPPPLNDGRNSPFFCLLCERIVYHFLCSPSTGPVGPVRVSHSGTVAFGASRYRKAVRSWRMEFSVLSVCCVSKSERIIYHSLCSQYRYRSVPVLEYESWSESSVTPVHVPLPSVATGWFLPAGCTEEYQVRSRR